MRMEELKEIARESGIVGAGGAGFPSYAKMTDQADTVILNCAECEPLLHLHKQLLASHAQEIVQMLDEVRETMGAKEAVVGIKGEHVHTVRLLEEAIVNYPKVRICALSASYPMGDEVILIYEATGRVIKPGGLPIDERVIVYNTETMFNLYRAVHQQIPVTSKLVSVVGAVENPVTVRVPLGTSVKEAISPAGDILIKNPVYVIGGPMMGHLGTENTVITKTTNAIIILPSEHKVVMRMHKNLDVERRRAASSCFQCRTCKDLCPRHALGHPIEPHRVMRAVANHDISDLTVYTNTAYCSSCGLCENYSCPQGLSPRSVIAQFKGGLRGAGVRVPKTEPAQVDSERELKKAPVSRLKAKLGLAEYDVPVSFVEDVQKADCVRIPLSQHIGAPALAAVGIGETMQEGQKIANAPDGLGVAIHASVGGVVDEVNEKEIVIRANR